MTLPSGLYDQLLTSALQNAVQALPAEQGHLRALEPAEAAERLTEEMTRQLGRILTDMQDGGSEKMLSQLSLVNGLLQQVRALYPRGGALVDPVTAPLQVLGAIHRMGVAPPQLPETGLAFPWLFTAARSSPSLINELRREAASCDRFDILVSFITMSGVRKLIDVLRGATAGDAQGVGSTRLRVLTTTYTGATEVAALDELARLNGCEVKVSLDGRRTRLHAKAWIFQRRSGFGSAYVGSANLSRAALMGGLEWTVKFTERGQSVLYERARAHFDTLWLDDEFTTYRPDDPTSRNAVIEALRREGSGFGVSATPFFFDIEPKHYQREILEELQREREHGRNRNLIVAATGTGKTVIAALDYRETCAQTGDLPRLLYVAHRAQILRQALRTYREVLRDNTFGELLTGGVTPERHDHLFASIDSLSSRRLVERLGPEYWHTVVLDECHRLAASRFHQLASAIRPAHLLGLTATPERTDGQPIAQYFTPRPDGAPAAELRLWHALDMQLLTPFEYYGCDDETDFLAVPWGQASETAAIDFQVRANAARAKLVIREWQRLSGNPREGRALVFCVSVAHALFMTEMLNAAGLPAQCVHGESPQSERLRAPHRLASGEICALVTVDLYNEGVDLPTVDTLLLLRPTQSPVLFQQQIGRGLRLSPGKEGCLVLDFVGQYQAEFRFDRLLGGITGQSRRELIDSVKHGFSALPPGCHIHLQHQTREQVLRSLQTLVGHRWIRLTDELRTYSATRRTRDVTLGEFLHDQQVSLDDIYRAGTPSGWTSLQRSAGLLAGPATAGESDLSRRLRFLLHVDDPDQIRAIRHVAEAPATYEASSPEERMRAQMITYQIDSSSQPRPFDSMVRAFAENPECARELAQLADVLGARSRIDSVPVPGMDGMPLCLHAAYGRREIFAAVGVLTPDHWHMPREGVFSLAERRCELLFVTLDKSSGFHDRIAYRDYAVSPSRFHWETQNAAGPDTGAGRRYLNSIDGHGWTFQLFVRATKTAPFRACGPVRVASRDDIHGDRPMGITWTLEVPLPPRLFAEFSVLRGVG